MKKKKKNTTETNCGRMPVKSHDKIVSSLQINVDQTQEQRCYPGRHFVPMRQIFFVPLLFSSRGLDLISSCNLQAASTAGGKRPPPPVCTR